MIDPILDLKILLLVFLVSSLVVLYLYLQQTKSP